MPEQKCTRRGLFPWKCFSYNNSPKRNIQTTFLTLWREEITIGQKVVCVRLGGGGRMRVWLHLLRVLSTGCLWQPVYSNAGAIGWWRSACCRGGWDHAVDFVLQRAAQPVVKSTECSLLWTELELFQPTLFEESYRHRGEKTGKITPKLLKSLCSLWFWPWSFAFHCLKWKIPSITVLGRTRCLWCPFSESVLQLPLWKGTSLSPSLLDLFISFFFSS